MVWTATDAAAAADAAADRDEPPGAGASLRRIDEQPPFKRPETGGEGEALAYEGAIAALQQLYGAHIEATRRRAPKSERVSLVRALRRELSAALREITERQRTESATRREARRLARPDQRQCA